MRPESSIYSKYIYMISTMLFLLKRDSIAAASAPRTHGSTRSDEARFGDDITITTLTLFFISFLIDFIKRDYLHSVDHMNLRLFDLALVLLLSLDLDLYLPLAPSLSLAEVPDLP